MLGLVGIFGNRLRHTPGRAVALAGECGTRPGPARRTGAPVEQRAILACTLQKGQVNNRSISDSATLCSGSGSGFCFQASSPSAGQDGPLLYPGPLCGGESGSTGRAAGVDRDVGSFSHGQDARSKSPASTHGLAGQDARQAPSGVAFLFGYLSLWPRKEKVTRPPKEGESSSIWTSNEITKASWLPQAHRPC